MSLSLRSLFFVLLALFALLGCRTPVATEAGLDAGVFASGSSAITKDLGGRLFGVAPQGTPLRPFATISSGEETHLFAVLPRGERAGQLIGLTRFEMSWYNSAVSGRGQLRFHSSLDELALSAPIGIWSGGSETSIRWIGPEPAGAWSGVAIPLDSNFEFGLGAAITGVVQIENGTLQGSGETTIGTHGGPYLVLLDGLRSEEGPMATNLLGRDLPRLTQEGWLWKNSNRSATVSSSAEVAQLAGEIGVELLFAPRSEGALVGFARDAGAARVGPFLGRVSLAKTGLHLPDSLSNQEQVALLRGLDSLYKGNYLATIFYLNQAGEWTVRGSQRQRTLAMGDLHGAAGFESSARTLFLQGQEGFTADSAYFLGRTYFYSGDERGVRANLVRSGQILSNAQGSGPHFQRGRAQELEGALNRALGRNDDAYRAFLNAASSYGDAGDPYREGLARRSAALLQPAEAERITLIASGLREAGASYEATRTLYLGASRALWDRNWEVLENLLARAEESPGEGIRLSLWRESLRDSLAGAQGEHKRRRELDRLIEQAQRERAREAALLYAVLRERSFPTDDAESMEQILAALYRATTFGEVETFSGLANPAYITLCMGVSFGDHRNGSSWSSQSCGERLRYYSATPAGAATIIQGGYRFLQSAEIEAAIALEGFLAERIPDESQWDLVWGDYLFFKAALHEEWRRLPGYDSSEDLVVDSIQRAFETLRRSLPSRDAPDYLLEKGAEFQARGYERLSAALYRAARQAARNANRPSVEFDAALRQAEALYGAQSWRELTEVDDVSSPLHSVRINLYRAHGHRNRDNLGTARELETQALREAREFGELQRLSIEHLRAELALSRGDNEAAQEALQRALEINRDLAENLRSRAESRVLHSRTLIRQGIIAYQEGNLSEARQMVSSALSLLDERGARAPTVRLEALKVSADLTADPEEFNSHLNALRTLFTESRDEPLTLQRNIASVLLELEEEISTGRGALPLVQPLLNQGFAISGRRGDHHCLLGIALLNEGEQLRSGRHLEACAASEIGHRAAQANLVLAMIDEGATPAYRAGLVRHYRQALPERMKRQQRRLEWMEAFARGSGAIANGETLERQYQQTRVGSEPADRLRATIDYLEYLIATGDFQGAASILQSDSSIFYDRRLAAEYQWVRLRVLSQLRQLRPFEVIPFAERAFSEAMPQNDDEEAESHYLLAIAYLQAGQYFGAREELDQAMVLASGTSGIWGQLEALDSTLVAIRP